MLNFEEEICGVPCQLQSQEIARRGRKMMHDDIVMVHAKPTGDEFRITSGQCGWSPLYRGSSPKMVRYIGGSDAESSVY